jgi:hypothetical protein
MTTLYLRERGALGPQPSPALWKYSFVADYLALMRRGFAITRAGGHVRLGWAGADLDLQAFRREFRLALNRRINLKAGDDRETRWRKWDHDYQIALRRDARRVNEYSSRRIVDPINRLSTPELQRRFCWEYTRDGLNIRLYNPAKPKRTFSKAA